jgi:hypothetical protein
VARSCSEICDILTTLHGSLFTRTMCGLGQKHHESRNNLKSHSKMFYLVFALFRIASFVNLENLRTSYYCVMVVTEAITLIASSLKWKRSQKAIGKTSSQTFKYVYLKKCILGFAMSA